MSLDNESMETALCGRLMRLLSFASDSVYDDAEIIVPEVLRFIERKMNTEILIMKKSAQGIRTRHPDPLLFESLAYFCRCFPAQTQKLLQIAVEYMLVVFDCQSSS